MQGYTYNVETKGNKVILTVDIDYVSASIELKQKISTATTYDEVKKEQEQKNLICK